MTNLIQIITTYNLLNYLIPGVLFVIFAEYFTHYSFLTDNVIIGMFLYYFIGMLISRFGSMVIEPFLKNIGFLNFAEYSDFVRANKEDSKIETLSVQNNQYRTIVALPVSLIVLKIWEHLSLYFSLEEGAEFVLFLLFLFLLFLFAYRKQTDYIRTRVNKS